ncbi:MAG: LacI family DNA-binding transcriptional regulator [Hyphomicrobiales bacterium]
MQALPTNADIAKAAGVSPAIVSRIVNRDSTLRVSKETRERVLRIIEEMDYAPNVAARSLKSSTTGVIALIVHDLTSSVYAEIIAGAHEGALKFGKAVLVGEANEVAAGPSHLETLIAGRGVDGVILQGAGTRLDHALERANRHDVPIVLLQSGDAQKNRVVRLDDEAAGRAATEHLLDLGHQRIGFIGVDGSLLFSEGRARGWRNALMARGITPDPAWQEDGGNKFPTGEAAAHLLLERAQSLTALVVANVASCLGVNAALHDRNVRVPRDLSVISIHDIALADYLRPALTVVRMPLLNLGRRAVYELCGQTAETGVVVADLDPPELIVRATTQQLENP